MNQPNLLHERRSFASPETAPVIQDGEASRSISGLAIVYESESEVLYDWWENRSFVEIVHRGAVTPELLASSDILALYEHDRKQLLARSTFGQGTLALSITDEGLRYSFDAPNTRLGDDVLELLRRGDLRSSSFLFGVKDGDTRWEQKSDGTWIRHIDRFSFLGDVSVVSQPAYPASSSSAERSREALDAERAPFVPIPPQEEEQPAPRSLSPLETYALRRADLLAKQ